MFTIIKRRELNPTVTELCIHAPLIAKKAKAGQFIIVRAKEDSERIPLTIAGFDREAGTVSIIFQVVGAGTMQLNSLKEGEAVHDFVGPLGKATEIEGLKNVCVVGGGDVAVEDAIYLANMCNSVTVFHRRDELRANKRSQDAAFANGKITFVWNTIVTELKGDDQLRSVVTKNVKTDEVKEWTFDGCFIFVGYDPNQDVYPQGLATDERGYVLTDENMATNIPGVYAVGDVRKKNVRQVATAVGDGGIVMSDIERYFREGGAQA